MGVHPSQIRRLEEGRARLTVEHADCLCQLLGVTLATFFGPVEERFLPEHIREAPTTDGRRRDSLAGQARAAVISAEAAARQRRALSEAQRERERAEAEIQAARERAQRAREEQRQAASRARAAAKRIDHAKRYLEQHGG